MPAKKYVHGYSKKESVRLRNQADTVARLLHDDTVYPTNSRILEAGCGVGAQTIYLARNSPRAKIVSVDISEASLKEAKKLIEKHKIKNVLFQQADIFDLPFEDESFDHVFVCFLLEHLPNPVKALSCLRKALKKGGSITVFEGDHGSCYFYPESKESVQTWKCLIRSQADLKGDSLIGRQLYPLLKRAGFKKIEVVPRMIYIDSSKPGLVDGFIRKTIIPMVEGVRRQSLKSGLMSRASWEKGIKDLRKSAGPDGTFCYTFFKARAKKK